MISEDQDQYVRDAVDQGMSPQQIAKELPARFPGLTMDQGADAIRVLLSLTRNMQKLAVKSAEAFGDTLLAADPVQDAAQEASLLRLAFPDATPADIGAQVRQSYPALTLAQVAQVLVYGPPYEVFPDLQPAEMAATLVDPRLGGAAPGDVATALHAAYPALGAVDVGTQLMAQGVFPGINAAQMTDALTQAGFASDQVSAAVAQLFGPTPGEQPLLIQFTGSNQVQVPSLAAYNIGPQQPFTVEAWILAPQQNNLHSWDNNIIEKWSDDGDVAGRSGYPFALRIANQNGPAGHLFAARYDLGNNPSIQSSGAFMDGRFHHVAFTGSGGQLTLYVDGQVQGTAADTTSGSTANDWPLYFGVRGGAMWPDNFTGRIMEVRLWNLARSQDEIQQAMRRTVDPASPGLVGYFKLREGSGTAAVDSTAAANNGVITDPGWSPVQGYPLVETRSLPPVGGGGAAFDDTAAALALGQPLTRIQVHSGNIVDAVQAFYGPDASPLPSHGGGGGGPSDVVVDPNDPVTGVSGYWGSWFGGVYILQLTLTTQSGRSFGPFGNMEFAGSRTPFLFQAAPGESLLAFAGTVGMGNNGQSQFLGSLGVTFQVTHP
jgi:uncharacterized protein (DUF433 family)